MEHDEEKIREKIQLADATPVVWNKQQVWHAIERKPATKSRTLLFYYAAASVFLATALVIYSMERTHQRKLDVQLAQLELAIVKESNQRLIVYKDQPSTQPQEKCTTEVTVAKIPDEKKWQPAQPVKRRKQTEEILLTAIEPELKTDVDVEPKNNVASESQSTPAVLRVAAIIGSENNTMIVPSSADKRMVLKIQFTESEPEMLERRSRAGELIFKH